VTCKVRSKDGFTRYARNPSQLPLKEGFVVDGSFEIVGHRGDL
jgi:hypothetical protein